MIQRGKKLYSYFASLCKGYHVILIPKDRKRTKAFQVSGFSLKVLIASVFLAIPLFLVSVISTVHYQNRLVAFEHKSDENQELLESKNELILQVANLEKNLKDMDETVNHLSQVLDIDPKNLETGLGPVSIMDIYTDDEQGLSPKDLVEEDGNLIEDWIETNGDISRGKFNQKMVDLKQQAGYLNQRIKSLYDQNKDKIRFVSATPTNLPVNGWVTSEYGMRSHPLSHRYKMHYGVDIASPHGTAIESPADGVIVYTGYSGGYGKVVVIDHGYGIASLMAHTSVVEAKLGDRVAKGDVVARVGSTGAASGSHLHYEIRVDGIPTDPVAFISQQ